MKNKKVKICFVASVDITVKFLLFSSINFFSNHGYDVSVVCSDGRWVESLRAQGINIKVVQIKRKISPFSDLISLFNLFLYFKKEKFDIVFTFTPKPGLLGQLAAKIAGVNIIINTIFGFYFNDETPYLKRIFFISIERIAASLSSSILFRNREDFDTAKKIKIGTDLINYYIGDGIDVSKFNLARFSLEFIKNKKKELGIPLENPVIGIVARLVYEKGYLELFEAFKNVLMDFPNAILLIIGSVDDQKKDSIDLDIINSSIVGRNIIFLGERTDIDEIYAVMDVFVLPSYREGFSHSIMEASAMSKPVITSDIRGCRGAVIPGVTGILVPLKDIQKLSKAITFIFSNPNKAKQMGMEGREKAEKDFDEDLIFDKMYRIVSMFIDAKIK